MLKNRKVCVGNLGFLTLTLTSMNINIYIERLNNIFITNNISICHGITHAKKVLENAINALDASSYDINNIEKEYVLLASLLHDADDRKFFPNNHNNENLRTVLYDKSDEYIHYVIYLVNMVSCSKNGDTIPESVIGKEWQLIPRYADRLEAIGIIGIERCFIYNKRINMKLFTNNTPRPKTEEEIWEIANFERYSKYNGTSESMIDHYYDKLLRSTYFPIRNPFFDNECSIRRKQLIQFILKFGQGDINNDNDVLVYINNLLNL